MKNFSGNYKLRRNLLYILLSLILIWSIFTFLIYPNLMLLKVTMISNGKLDIASVIKILQSARVAKVIRNSIILAVSLTITVNILGIFEILVLDYFEIKGRKWLNIAYHSPLICNGMVLVLAYNFILGSKGFVTANLMKIFPGLDANWFLGFGAVLIELTFAGTSNHIMFVRDALKNIDYQTIEAAQNMGARPHRILIKIVLATLKPAIFAASILTFIVGVSAFATPQVLGGEKFETINPLVMSFSRTLTTRNYAAILAVFLGMITVSILIFTNYIERKKKYISISKVKTPMKKTRIKNPVLNIAVTVIAQIIALIHTLPLIFVLIFSFMKAGDLYSGNIDPNKFTLANYKMVLNSTTGLKPVLTSFCYSVLAAFSVVVIILILARIVIKYRNRYTRLLEMTLLIPWFLPSTLIALGLIMTFTTKNILVFGNVITGTIYIILIGYIIVKIPYTLRMIKAAYAGVDNALEEAAKNLGASMPATYLKIILPIIWPSVLSVFLLIFISLLAEYNMSVFLFHPLYQPLGVVLNAATSQGSTPEGQMLTFVYSVFIMIVSSGTICFVYGRKNSSMKKL